MNKKLCVISAPPETYSGYGSRSRDFIKALYELKKDVWDIKILSQRWGATPWSFIQDHKEEWGWMEPLILRAGMNQQPDVWIQITVPNEFQAVGKVNIGVTAGIETTICDSTWIDGCNRMDVTLVSSNHAKQVFRETSFQEKNQQGQFVRDIKLQKPVEVLFEGVNLNQYFYQEPKELPKTDLVNTLSSIPETFCFLYVGHWLQGELGEDRKNTGMLVKTFLETFKNKKVAPALILKTSMSTSCIMDRDQLMEKIDGIRKQVKAKELPNIYVVHGELEDSDINNLYNHPKVKAMVSFTKGEGFGRPLAEFCLSKKPVIASGWSGHTDFLSPETSFLLPGSLTKVHPSAQVQNMILADASWFTPDYIAATNALNEVYQNPKKFEVPAKKQGHKIKTEFSFEAMVELLGKHLDTYVKLPEQVALKLPTLKKIQLPNKTV
jgi:glycosyltransferase involved in cell wall biosynthesis